MLLNTLHSILIPTLRCSWHLAPCNLCLQYGPNTIASTLSNTPGYSPLKPKYLKLLSAPPAMYKTNTQNINSFPPNTQYLKTPFHPTHSTSNPHATQHPVPSTSNPHPTHRPVPQIPTPSNTEHRHPNGSCHSLYNIPPSSNGLRYHFRTSNYQRTNTR